MELLTAARMGEIEKRAIEAGAATGRAMMERAGRGVVEAALAARPALEEGARRACVLCGPGNNGGDGYVVARRLAARGWRVEVFALGDPEKLRGDAAEAARRWREAGGVGALEDAAGAMGAADLVVDALFGAGLARALEGPAARLAEEVRPSGFRVAVDAPSGLCMDSGRPLGPVMAADLTVTFHRPRPGHFLADGPARCGAVRIVDIGLIEAGTSEADARLAGPPGAEISKRGGHKYAHGHAVVLSGGVGRGGAARMAARGALRVGSGLVTLVCPPAAVLENAARLDAIMLRPAEDAAALSALIEDPRLNAFAMGMGLGAGRRERGLVRAALETGRPAVLDADAITLFAEAPETLFSALNPGCVLTPHPGEFRRVFPDIAERLSAPPEGGPAFSRLDAAREAAARAGCVVLLKGPDTVIADPQGRAVVNAAVYERAVPWLATAGAGDVLSGMVAGLLARGRPPLEAAAEAAWLHVEAARVFGPGLVAEDLPETLPAVFRELGF
jgi:hydroxyethylthiazole kinase-like uncharacterized protein yjeF